MLIKKKLKLNEVFTCPILCRIKYCFQNRMPRNLWATLKCTNGMSVGKWVMKQPKASWSGHGWKWRWFEHFKRTTHCIRVCNHQNHYMMQLKSGSTAWCDYTRRTAHTKRKTLDDAARCGPIRYQTIHNQNFICNSNIAIEATSPVFHFN